MQNDALSESLRTAWNSLMNGSLVEAKFNEGGYGFVFAAKQKGLGG
jgi:hypothetical protein